MRACPTVLTSLLSLALAAQGVTRWHPIANPWIPAASAWDSARQRTIHVTMGWSKQWEWDGAALEERQHALAGGDVFWLADDPAAGQLVAVGRVFPGGQRAIGRWNGARWTWQTPTPPLLFDARYCFDEVRGRIVAYDGRECA